MPAYFVRMVHSHELVGVYSASGLDSLRDLVDEATDVTDCEYLEAGDGGLHQPTPVPARLPVRLADNPEEGWHPDDLAMWTGAQPTESWFDAMMSGGAEWTPLA